jgi:hypothetical protein
VAAGTWSWREVPVLEALLRLTRHDELATPETIAAEAILHPDDVTDAIRQLAADGFVELLRVDAVTVVSPAPNFATLIRQVPYSATFGPTKSRKRSSTSPGSA